MEKKSFQEEFCLYLIMMNCEIVSKVEKQIFGTIFIFLLSIPPFSSSSSSLSSHFSNKINTENDMKSNERKKNI